MAGALVMNAPARVVGNKRVCAPRRAAAKVRIRGWGTHIVPPPCPWCLCDPVWDAAWPFARRIGPPDPSL